MRIDSGIIAAMLILPGGAAAAEHEVIVQNFGFEPAELTVQAGDTVTWRNESGTHNVVADDGAFDSGAPASGNWTLSHTFDDPGEFPYFCELHGAAGGVGMAGRIVVEGTPSGFIINEGLNGVWFNPGTDGQGWLFDVSPPINLFFGAWFTWNLEGGGYDWFTAQGSYEGNRAVVPLIRSRGGRFNTADPVTFEQVGEAEFIFESCDRAEVRFRLDDNGQEGTIPLQRITPVPAACESAQAR